MTIPLLNRRAPDELATAPVRSSSRVHLPALDGMRGAGILVVMITHFARVNPSGAGVPVAWMAAVDISAYALPMFFVFSGFLITGILLEAREKPRYFRNFYMRRALRILPLYYGVLTLLFVIRPSWGRMLGGTSSPLWLWTYVANFEIARRGHCTYAFLCHFWSLMVEEQYYLVWPLIVLALRPRWLLAVCAIMAGFSVILRIVLTFVWHNAAAAYVLTPCQLDPLCAGGALAILVRERPLPQLRTFARIAVSISLAAFVLFRGYEQPAMSDRVVVGRPLLSCFLFGGVILLAIGDSGLFRAVLGARPLTFVGKYSYGLYVFHSPLMRFLDLCFPRDALARALGSPAFGLGLSVLLSIAGTLVVAIASYELFERQFLKMKTRFG